MSSPPDHLSSKKTLLNIQCFRKPFALRFSHHTNGHFVHSLIYCTCIYQERYGYYHFTKIYNDTAWASSHIRVMWISVDPTTELSKLDSSHDSMIENCHTKPVTRPLWRTSFLWPGILSSVTTFVQSQVQLKTQKGLV